MGKKVNYVGSQPDPTEIASILTASTPEGRENELINMSYNEVAWRIANHAATSAELVHFLKMGSERERLEKEKLEVETELQRVKAEAIEATKSMEQVALKAIEAMKSYRYIGTEEGEVL